MTEIKPIPGVTYVIENTFGFDKQVFLATYCPQVEDDDSPWVDLDGEWRDLRQQQHRILDEAYNPHPPTRTEWALSWYGADDVDQSKETFGGNEMLARERHAAYLKNPVKPFTRRLMRRQVTEWVGVAE